MSQHPVHHATFAITRDFEAPAARLWGAFARQDLKDRWFGAHGDAVVITERTFDFRPGGRETAVGHWKTGMVSTPPSSPANYPSISGTPVSAIPPWPTPSWIAWCTMPIRSI